MVMTSLQIRSARAERAVPPGRIAYDLEADVLLLHTIQTMTALEELLTTGTLRPDPTLVDSSWPDAYDWMGRMMAARLPTSGAAALWLWARIRRVDLVGNCRRARGQVLLTCRVPRERVLLSHFDEWHTVLNSNVAIPQLPGEQEDTFGKRWDQPTTISPSVSKPQARRMPRSISGRPNCVPRRNDPGSASSTVRCLAPEIIGRPPYMSSMQAMWSRLSGSSKPSRPEPDRRRSCSPCRRKLPRETERFRATTTPRVGKFGGLSA